MSREKIRYLCSTTGHYNDMNLLGKYLIDKREI